MATLILDRNFAEELRQQRAESGADRWDEVWEGTYMMTPLPNVEHQDLVSKLTAVLSLLVNWDRDKVFAGANVSDRREDWTFNYRCPDVAVYLADNPARNCGTHWCGGPDLAVEVLSPDDRAYEKIPFYAEVGTREVLFIQRTPWRLELYRLSEGNLALVGTSDTNDSTELHSAVLPISLRLVSGTPRPRLEIRRIDSEQSWKI